MGVRRGVWAAGLLVGLVLGAGCGKTQSLEEGPPQAGEQPAPPDDGSRETPPDSGTPPDAGPGPTGSAKPPSTGQTEWMRQFGGDGHEHAMAVAVDAEGNVLLGGDYEGSARFGGEPLPDHGRWEHRYPDDRDAVVAKYSPSGEHLWSRGFGHAGGSAWVHDVAVQGREVLVVGESTAGLEAEGTKVSAGPFLLRLDAGGRVLRAVSLEVPAQSVVAEPSGDLLVAGSRSTPGSSYRTTLHLSRLNTLGAPRWRREFIVEGPARVHALERDGSGLLYMAGEHKGAIGLGRVRVPGGPGTQPFVAKLSADGEPSWARSFSPPPGVGRSDSSASVLGLAVGGDGQVVVSGSFRDGLDLDGERHVALSNEAGFLASLQGTDGKAKWVRWLSSDNSVSLRAVQVDAEGDVLTAGLFRGTALVGGVPLTNRHEYVEAVLVAKYRPSGEHVWSRVLSHEQGFWMAWGAMACAPSGRVVFPALAGSGDRRSYDVFLWSLDAPAPGSGSLLLSDTELYFGRAVVGHARPAKLVLGNTGPARTLRFEVSGPFSVDVAERTLGQGERMEVGVSFLPQAAGEATGELRVLGDGEPRRVALVGSAVESCPEVHASCRSYQVTAGACILQSMADGSACGPETCGGRDVCRSARCVRETPPEGASCQTACGGAGTCHDKRCLPPGGSANELWSHDPGLYKVIRSNVVMDVDGGLYFRECPYEWDGYGCELVALDANGSTRYRVGEPAGWCAGPLTLVGDQLVSSCGTRLTALRVKDAAVLYDRSFDAEVNSLFGQPVASWAAWSHDGGQRLFLVVSAKHEGVDRGLVLGLEASTGEPVWRQVYEGSLEGAVSDERGNLYFALRPPGGEQGGQWVVSLDGQGQERWRRHTPLLPRPYSAELGMDPPRAVFAGTLMLQGLRGLATEDGSERFMLPRSRPDYPWSTSVVLLEGLGAYRDGFVLRGFDPVSGGARWTYQVPGGVFLGSTLSLSASASTLFTASGRLRPEDHEESYDDVSGHSPSLCAVSAGGTLERELALPGSDLFTDAWLSPSPGRLVMMRWKNWSSSNSPPAFQLHVFEVPWLEPAPGGWLSEEGGPFGGRRPLIAPGAGAASP